MVPQKKFIITYTIPGSDVVHKTNSINASSIIEAKNKFKASNPTKKIIACVKVLG
jgi:hypothetical protein